MSDKDEFAYRELNKEVREVDEIVLSNWWESLVNIKGIGIETAKDLGLMFGSEEELIDAISNDRVPLRNDKVKLLKKYFIKMKGGINE